MADTNGAGATPRLRFPGFEEDWIEQPLGRFLTESRIAGSDGSVAKKLTVKLWGNGVFAKTEAIRGSANTQYYKRRSGQFIYSKLDFLNAAFGIVPAHLDGFESTADLPCFDVDSDLDGKFLLEYVGRADFYKRFGEIADGGRKAKRIQVESFLSFPIAIPARIVEQRKIADCLTSLDEVIAAQAQKVEALKAHKQGLMQQLFPREGETVPRLRFPGSHEVPSWQATRLNAVLDESKLKSDGASRVHSVSVHKGLIDQIEHLGRSFAAADTSHYSLVRPFDIVYTKSPTGDFPFGIVKQSRLPYAVIVSPLYGVFTPVNRHIGRIIEAFFEAPARAANYLAPIVTKGAKNTIQISNPKFLAGEIPLPVDLDEQRLVATSLSLVDARVVAEAEKLKTLRSHKQGLMQQLFPSREDA